MKHYPNHYESNSYLAHEPVDIGVGLKSWFQIPSVQLIPEPDQSLEPRIPIS